MLVDYATLRDALREYPESNDPAPRGYACHAVCLLIVDRAEPTLLAIQKADSDDYDWGGHVALPGGRIEPTDPTPHDAALRELQEELGIERTKVDVLGNLGHFQTNNATNDLEVLLGRWMRSGALRVDDREIKRVLELPLAGLAESHIQRGFRSRHEADLGDDLVYPLYDAEIWGVTARIVHAFLELALDRGILTSAVR